MYDTCPRFSLWDFTPAPNNEPTCRNLALAFYAAVRTETGNAAYLSAQQHQTEHENSEVCCDPSGDNVECCAAEDCVGDDVAGSAHLYVCEAYKCLRKGNPRFALSWNGDDDLDLHVITPGGFEIFYADPDDPVSGGALDHDDIPIAPGYWIENVYFPETDDIMVYPSRAGTYRYFVDNYSQVETADDWTLKVYIGDELVEVRRGTSSSVEFTYIVP